MEALPFSPVAHLVRDLKPETPYAARLDAARALGEIDFALVVFVPLFCLFFVLSGWSVTP